ncbi:MAG: imidazoleglycerol-phosphate dehydratase HisB [Dissulfuribacterales bacterium]
MIPVKISRSTAETDIQLDLNLRGEGRASIQTGIGFLNHMLVLWAVHGLFDLTIEAKGDLHVDFHHTVEDIGICLGQAFRKAVGDAAGLRRYGNFSVPMDEALAHVYVDVSNRPYLVFHAQFPVSKIGEFDVELVEEFMRAFVLHSGITLHVHVEYGKNGHHMVEAVFKAMARALSLAVSEEPRLQNRVFSSKGVL